MKNWDKISQILLIIILFKLVSQALGIFWSIQNITISSNSISISIDSSQAYFAISVQQTHIIALAACPSLPISPVTLYFKVNNISNNSVIRFVQNFGNFQLNTTAKFPKIRTSKTNTQTVLVFSNVDGWIVNFGDFMGAGYRINVTLYTSFSKLVSADVGCNSTEVFAVIKKLDGNYTLLRYINGTVSNFLQLGLTGFNINLFKMLYYNQFIYIHFGIIVRRYDVSSNIMVFYQSFVFNNPIPNPQYSNLQAQNGFLIFTVGNQRHFIDLSFTGYSAIHYSLNSLQIQGIVFQTDYPQIQYFLYGSLVQQADQSNYCYSVDQQSYNRFIGKIGKSMGYSRFVLYDNIETTQVFSTNLEFFSGLPQTYRLSGSSNLSPAYHLGVSDRAGYDFWIRNNAASPPIFPSGPVPLPPITNTVSNTSINTGSNSGSSLISSEGNTFLSNYFVQASEQFNNNTLQIIGSVFFFTSARISPKFLICLLMVFDDFQFYQYHRSILKYPQTVRFIFSKIQILNKFRLAPSFAKIVNFMNNSLVAIDKNILYSEYFNQQILSNSTQNPQIQQIYFLTSSEGIYKTSLILNALYFTILKIILSFMLIISTRLKFKLLNKIYCSIKNQTKWWTLLVAILEANLCNVYFQCVLQFMLTGLVDWTDKINMMVAVAFLYVGILYTVGFYVLIYKYDQRESSQILLIRCKYQYLSFHFQPLLIQGRLILKSIIHSLFIKNYQYQVFILALIDFPFIFCSIKMKKLYQNNCIYIFCTSYMVFFFLFDFYFALQNIFLLHNYQFAMVFVKNRQIIGLALISLILLSKIMVSFGLLFSSVKYIFGNVDIIKPRKINNDVRVSLNQSPSQFKNKTKTIPKQIKMAMNTILDSQNKLSIKQRQKICSKISTSNKIKFAAIQNNKNNHQYLQSKNKMRLMMKIKEVKIYTKNFIVNQQFQCQLNNSGSGNYK